jgi:hypothetical protein
MHATVIKNKNKIESWKLLEKWFLGW